MLFSCALLLSGFAGPVESHETAAKDPTGAITTDVKASRTISEIRETFERQKEAILASYNRALKSNPQLRGKIVLELQIASSGRVVDCRVVSSELRSGEFESTLLAIIRELDFGAKNVRPMTVAWPMNFLPS